MENSKQILVPNRYLVSPRTLIFIQNKDDILLIKGAKDKKIWPGLYNGIGGHVEKGEDVLSAARRELTEESGLEKIDLFLKAIIFIEVNENTGISMYVFWGETTKKDVRDSTEGSLEWINLNNLQNYPMVEDLYELIPKIINHQKECFFGRYYYLDKKLVMEFTN